jgi:Ni/Co efflux regulator RcnB
MGRTPKRAAANSYPGHAAPGHRSDGASTGRVYTYGRHHFHGVYAPSFVYPPGMAYRHWPIGAAVPAALLTPTYAFTGYSALGLPPPAAGHEWLRYGPDLLLVDSRSGAVLHATYGVFRH